MRRNDQRGVILFGMVCEGGGGESVIFYSLYNITKLISPIPVVRNRIRSDPDILLYVGSGQERNPAMNNRLEISFSLFNTNSFQNYFITKFLSDLRLGFLLFIKELKTRYTIKYVKKNVVQLVLKKIFL